MFTAKQVGAAGLVGKGHGSARPDRWGLGVHTQVEIPGDLSEWQVWARFIGVEKRT